VAVIERIIYYLRVEMETKNFASAYIKRILEKMVRN